MKLRVDRRLQGQKFDPKIIGMNTGVNQRESNRANYSTEIKLSQNSLERKFHRRTTCEAVGDIDTPAKSGPEQHPQDALASVFGHTVVVVDDTQQHQRMHHHLLDACGRCANAGADHIHCWGCSNTLHSKYKNATNNPPNPGELVVRPRPRPRRSYGRKMLMKGLLESSRRFLQNAATCNKGLEKDEDDEEIEERQRLKSGSDQARLVSSLPRSC